MTATLLRAAWVAPMDRPVFRDGAILVDSGRIVAVGHAREFERSTPSFAVRDLGDVIVLPGLVNPHTHLELSHLTSPADPGRFTDWLTSVIGSAGDAAVAGAAARRGAAESIRFGVTTVGDISRHCAATRAALRASPLRVISFGEVVGMARRKNQLPDRLAAAVSTDLATTNVRPGISPHSPYSVDADGYRQCLAAARKMRLPLTTHLAESPDEAAFLSGQTGPFRELWDRLGAWDEAAVSRFDGGPVRYAASLGLLDYRPTALAHVNYCDDADLVLLADGRASVVFCPRTHAYFGHPPHRWRDMLSAGVNVAVGTDSRASSPNLNLADELRLLHQVAPDVSTQTLWRLATLDAARCLGMESELGSLSPGKYADFAVFRAEGEEPLAHLLESEEVPVDVWIAGRSVSGAFVTR